MYETAKYPVKSIDYLTNDRDENLQRVEDLKKGLKSKRLISFGGIFKEIRKELQLEDVESGDLIKKQIQKKIKSQQLGKWLLQGGIGNVKIIILIKTML